jgi:hypothetical protein
MPGALATIPDKGQVYEHVGIELSVAILNEEARRGMTDPTREINGGC